MYQLKQRAQRHGLLRTKFCNDFDPADRVQSVVIKNAEESVHLELASCCLLSI